MNLGHLHTQITELKYFLYLLFFKKCVSMQYLKLKHITMLKSFQ